MLKEWCYLFFFWRVGVGGRMRGHCLGFCVVFILFFYLVVPLSVKLWTYVILVVYIYLVNRPSLKFMIPWIRDPTSMYSSFFLKIYIKKWVTMNKEAANEHVKFTTRYLYTRILTIDKCNKFISYYTYYDL